MTSAPPSAAPARRRRVVPSVLGILAVLILLLIVFWSWDWFVPIIERQASAALQRRVTIAHLHVRLGKVTTVTLDDVHVDQPKGFESETAPFAEARHLTVSVDAWRYIWHRTLALPLIALDAPSADILRRADGTNNYTFGSSSGGTASSGNGGGLPEISVLQITDGHAHVRDVKLRADMHIAMHTVDPKGDDRGQIIADAEGRYAGQPINGHFVGGALLGVMDARPYPIDLTVHNGPTLASLKGTLDDPMKFAGAKLALHFSGPDMALLLPLTGIPIPHTPAYNITGNLDYTRNLIQFTDFRGRMGSSDIGGTIRVNPHESVPRVDADLRSRQVDLADLGGFIGAHPESKQAAAKADSQNPSLLPNTPIDVPKLRSVNAHLLYHGDHIENKRTPLDNIDADIAIEDGAIDVRHLNFAVGSGTLASGMSLQPADQGFSTKAHVDFARLDLADIMKKTTNSAARGIIGGHFTLTSRGRSMAELMANGDGGLTMALDQGGNMSALVPDVLGLEFGNAILTALGLPSNTDINCFIADMPLRNGVATTRTLMLDTKEARTRGEGTIDFRRNTIDYALTTRSQHFTVLSVPGAIHISGPIKSPSILPGAEVLGRTAAAVGLGILMPPAALLPTIQFGVGDKGACARLVAAANDNPAAGIAPGSLTGARPAHSSANGRHPQVKPTPGKHAGAASPADVRAAWAAKTQKNTH
ncbi:lipopolysaccharide biogenesis periplasmic protein AsmA [Ameyamaea chiangmaiensis NBRC 103196]|uniref:AsmA family protein n=1 Tax=Ameyamaea chiangmaiensis TaxID=442969 RepID=A0A850PER7_9PROT|nr:AsmA family protein [Ameyamaea chiangmaiensis]MBS4075713.1 AsmA family protein [Ameyamaea chiangmaiensis]NVN41169.1 AsmA family protein [Ameyamaea chiangmaiensis]GBQ70412.1 lipopolysaccharide biogenesis periplasmic protein AsmA [Ameyamaea chiangmaiensis NBRC 103196]